MILPGFQLIINKVSFLSSFLTHFSPTTSTLSHFNLLTILKMQFLSVILLMLANCSVCATFFAKYTAVLATFLAFRYSSLVSPFFHCFHAFRFSVTALSTTLLRHKVSLWHEHSPCIHQHISSAASKSSFLIYPQALFISTGIC